MSAHADAVGLQAHSIPCTNLADDSTTTIADLAAGKLVVLGAPRRTAPRSAPCCERSLPPQSAPPAAPSPRSLSCPSPLAPPCGGGLACRARGVISLSFRSPTHRQHDVPQCRTRRAGAQRAPQLLSGRYPAPGVGAGRGAALIAAAVPCCQGAARPILWLRAIRADIFPRCADFWTTKCTRCPMAIEKLNRMAAEPVYKDKVAFFTVNCDECVRRSAIEPPPAVTLGGCEPHTRAARPTHPHQATKQESACDDYRGRP
jgi:hypothetical protein